MNYQRLSIFIFIILNLGAKSQSVVITGDDSICIGQSTALHAETIGISAGTTSYTFEFIDFSTHPDFSGGTAIDPDFIHCNVNYDDCWAGGTPPDHDGYDIGFSFCFFNQHYTKFYVGSNGWIGFTDPTGHSWTTYTATPIPNPDPIVPKNCIFAPWQDWFPGFIPTENNVYYYSTGTAPDRKLVVYWRSCPLYKCRTNDTIRGSFMIVLNEGTGVIENFIQDKPNCPNNNEGATQGVHNIDGTIAFTATGRNYGVWEAFNEGTRFVPSGLIWYKDVYPGGPVAGYGPDVIFSPTTTTQYFAVVGTCDGSYAIDTITVTVNPLPSVNLNDFPSVCLNTPQFQLTGGTPSGGTYSGTGVFPTGFFDPSVAGIGAHTITYTYTEPVTGCIDSDKKTLTVKPLPNVVPAVPSPLTICSGDEAQVSLSSNVPGTETGTTFTWTASGNNATITPVPSSISGSGDILQNLANSGNILEPVVFHILPAASGCSPTSPSDFTFNVNPVPMVSSSPGTQQIICSATATQPINLQTNVTGLSPAYNWTSACDPVITGCPPASGTDNPIASFSPVNPSASRKSITFSITASLEATSGSCYGPASGYTILVNPRPNVTNSVLSQVICSGTQSTPVVLLADIPGTSFSWTSSASPGITGNTPSGNGDIPAQALFISGTNSQGSVTYTITPYYSQDGVECAGPAKDYTILVNPRPNVTNTTLSQEVCSGLQTTPVILLSDIIGSTFSWISSASPGITGNTPSGNGDLPVEILFNGTASQGSVTYTITPYYSRDGVECAGPVKDYTILVNPLPVPPLSGSASFCEGTSGIVYTTQESMTSYSWTVSPAGTITAGGSPSSSSVTVTWNAALPDQYVEVNYVDLKGCTALVPTRLNVTIHPAPALSVSGAAEICAGSLNVNYSTAAGMNPYAWTISPGGTPVGSVNTNSVNVNWDAGASSMQSVMVSYANTLGCSNSTVYPVTVHPLPVSTFTGTTTVCQLHPDAYLYHVDNGPDCSYNWSITPTSYGSIMDKTLSPASITWNTPGDATLHLETITSFGCTTSSSQPIIINPRPDVSITPCFDLITSRSAKRFLLKGGKPLLTATPQQGEYLINPATVALVFEAGNYYFDPTLIQGNQTNTYAISYKYTSSQFGCPAVSPAPITLTVRGPNPDCSYSMTDYRDNNTYRTALSGGKCWMMENLRYGNSLTPVTAAQTDNCVVEKYCLPQDENCTSYGGFYQWDELIQYSSTASPGYQGVCPPGWHIPSAADYQMLINANKGNALAGTVLTDLNLIPRGFEALLQGMAYYNIAWAFTSTETLSGTLFWTSTHGSANTIVTRGMNSKSQSVLFYETRKNMALPIRCIKD